MVALQEFIPLNPITAFTGPSVARVEDWEELLLSRVNANKEKIKYVKVESISMMGLYVILMAREECMSRIKEVVVDKVKLGFQGMIGNKGSVMIRFRYFSTSFCLLNAHLSHGQNNFEERFGQLRTLYNSALESGIYAIPVKEHDRVFILGDLNFRISLEGDKCRQLCVPERVEELREFDQFWLNYDKVMDQDDDPDLEEAKITFLPTYKYNIGSSVLDTSGKNRPPAWCDRIMWVGKGEKRIVCEKYASVPEVSYSDHKPLYGVFEVETMEEDGKRKDEVAKSLITSISEERSSMSESMSPDRKLATALTMGPNEEFLNKQQ